LLIIEFSLIINNEIRHGFIKENIHKKVSIKLNLVEVGRKAKVEVFLKNEP